ncbi:zf-HC2 domain-containing protein [Streptomyces sp. bgisy159]|uniref:zf-HC2 domain-containing protein n=1 Tax=Streptomyces sp. bgisy159 TaxID=3413795 RepID=UPI003F49D688
MTGAGRHEAYDGRGGSQGRTEGRGDHPARRGGHHTDHRHDDDHTHHTGHHTDRTDHGGHRGDGRGPDQPPPAPHTTMPSDRAEGEDTHGVNDEGDTATPPRLEHPVLKALLGAWALAACSAEEAAAVEAHLGDCGSCADEARRLREAVGLLQRPESLDLDPGLRTRVLDGCLDRRPPRIPVPEWVAPYDAETARLDALLQDFGDAEWHAPVRLRWYEGEATRRRRTTVAGVIAHLLAVDGLVAVALGLADPLHQGAGTADTGGDDPVATPADRTERYWKEARFPHTRSVRGPWRDQTHAIVRTASCADGGAGELGVAFGAGVELRLRDAMLDRAFECWVHAEDIADAVNYPHGPPAPRHLNQLIERAAGLLPDALAARRRAGLAEPVQGLVTAGRPGRSLRLEIEGHGGGQWHIPLDSPAALGSADHEVAHVALDGVEFCHLAAGRVPPEEAAAGQVGDRGAIRDVLFSVASLSRM